MQLLNMEQRLEEDKERFGKGITEVTRVDEVARKGPKR
jgi:hypothetical protein